MNSDSVVLQAWCNVMKHKKKNTYHIWHSMFDISNLNTVVCSRDAMIPFPHNWI